ncbi:hypothetical protein ABZW02_34670 [Streptomyces sp. NPDC005180]
MSGGFGGADGLNGTEVAIGAALILTAAAGGLLTMRRRHGSEPAA